MHCSNLWEALTAKSASDHEDKFHRAEWDTYLRELGESAAMSYQELSLHPDERGWIIKIFACNEDGKVEILIPKDRTQPVQVLMDTRKESVAYERH